MNLLEQRSSKSVLDMERQGYELDKLFKDMIESKKTEQCGVLNAERTLQVTSDVS
jgi:hypothetical protein